MFKIIKPYIVHYVIFILVILFLIFGYKYLWYRTKIVIKPVVKTLTKVITRTRYKYKTLQSKVQYIPKIEYKTKLPAWLTGQPDKILATGTIPSYGGKTSVMSTLNTKTGKGSISFIQLPYFVGKHKRSFFQWSNTFVLRGAMGYLTDKNGTLKTEMAGFQYNFIRVGNFHLKLQDNVYLNSRNTLNFIGIMGDYKF